MFEKIGLIYEMAYHSFYWWSWSAIWFIPLLIINIIKFFRPLKYYFYKEENTDDNEIIATGNSQMNNTNQITKLPLPNTKLDKIVRVFLWGLIFYYVTDSIDLILSMATSAPQYCQVSFLGHHTVTLLAAIPYMQLPYIPWFILAPFTTHSLLIMFPHTLFWNYVYIVFVLGLEYGLMQVSIFNNSKNYRWVRYYSYVLIFPLFGIWWFSCLNDLKHVTHDNMPDGHAI